MWLFVLFLLAPNTFWTTADDQHQNTTKLTKHGQAVQGASKGTVKGFYIGDPCETECSSQTLHTVCNRTTRRCQCDPKYPIVVENFYCVAPLRLGERCLYEQSCKYYDRNSRCAMLDDFTAECQCIPHYYPSIALEPVTKKSICVPEMDGPLLKSDVPTLIGVGVGLSVFTGLTCLVLKLFSRARFAQARAYGNANLPPPSTPSMMSYSQRCAHTRQLSLHGSEAMSTPDSPRRFNSSLNGNPANSSRKTCSNHGPRRQSSASFVSERSSKPPSRNSVRRVRAAVSLASVHQPRVEEKIELKEVNSKF